MQRYSEYKDSGVQWLGEIPSHWEVKRLGKICKFSKGLQFTKADLVDQGISVVSYGQVHAKYNKRTHLSDELIRFIPSDFKGKNEKAKVEIGDFIVADTSEDIEGCGNIAFNDCIEGLYGGYHTILIKELQIACKKYLSYFFNCTQWRAQIRCLVNGVKVYTISRDILKQSNVVFPSKEEQKSIVDYLDIVTSNIDKAITQQQKMIDLLNERKQIIINNAVTKGLNPNVKMKDSGVEWIGEIPEHWEVRRLKHIAKLQSGETISSDYFTEDGYPVFGGNGFRGFTNRYTNEGDYVLIGRQGALCGNVNYAYGRFYASEHAVVVYPYKLENIVWLGEVIRASNLNQYSQSAAQPGLAVSLIQNICYPYPPYEEREKIALFIERQIKAIEDVVKNYQRQIFLLQERKQIIINDVVTGKVKVV